MHNVNVAEVESKAASFEAFSKTDIPTDVAADYAARAANLREFARMIKSHRKVDADLEAYRAAQISIHAEY